MNINKIKETLNNILNNDQKILLVYGDNKDTLDWFVDKGDQVRLDVIHMEDDEATTIDKYKDREMVIFNEFDRGTTIVQNSILDSLEDMKNKYIAFTIKDENHPFFADKALNQRFVNIS